MIIAIDFDGVLFNVERFKEDYYRLFRGFGFSRKTHQEAYVHGVTKGKGVYSRLHHFRYLQRVHPRISPERLEKGVAALLKNSSHYVYHDAVPFLSSLKEKGARFVLLSSGRSFQREKVEESGLSQFFTQRFIITRSIKSAAMLRAVKRFPAKNTFFLDDKKNVVDDMKKEYPEIQTIQVRRFMRHPRSTHSDYVVKNLSEARRIVQMYVR